MIWTLAALALSVMLGAAAASASVSLPAGKAVTLNAGAPRRLAGITASAGLALWGGLVDPGPLAVVTAILGAWLLLLAVLDAEHLWLPLKLTLPLIPLGLLTAWAMAPESLVSHGLGAAIGYGALRGLAWLFRRLRGKDGLGGGDAWLAAAAGAWVGWSGLPYVLLIAASGAIAGVLALAALRRKFEPERQIPFGSWLAAGLWLVWLYG